MNLNLCGFNSVSTYGEYLKLNTHDMQRKHNTAITLKGIKIKANNTHTQNLNDIFCALSLIP